MIDPLQVIKTGPGHGHVGDPLPQLEKVLSQCREATIPGLDLPPLTGGAIGFIGYDCVRYFEPKTARFELQDVLKVPESLFMLFDTIVAFDHFFDTIKVITYLRIPSNKDVGLSEAYEETREKILSVVAILKSNEIPLPRQTSQSANGSKDPNSRQTSNINRKNYNSNIGQSGYESHVSLLKKYIKSGSIIQAVPSHRISCPTALHPFNLYRTLRTLNPSPYLFYIDCDSFQLVGASPELLVKSEKGRIITHPIAGTVARGDNERETAELAAQLAESVKDRAEHVMLVDLARNDINRVCDPFTTSVDRFMVVERFSHVQHLVSQVSGVLRPSHTRFDAFRSIFPAGTVSGAPKVRAMEHIASLEKEKRGVYAGAVGYFGYGSVSMAPLPRADDATDVEDGRRKAAVVEREGAMDTCIALRTMLLKDGIAYLQAGGGIVYDSDEHDEWIETMNKLGANMRCIEVAEKEYLP